MIIIIFIMNKKKINIFVILNVMEILVFNNEYSKWIFWKEMNKKKQISLYSMKYEFPQCIFFFGGDDRKCHIGKGFFSTNRLDKILGFYFWSIYATTSTIVGLLKKTKCVCVSWMDSIDKSNNLVFFCQIEAIMIDIHSHKHMAYHFFYLGFRI